MLHKSHTINLSNLLALVSHKLHSYFLLAIPSEFVKGKKEIRVKFVAHKGKQVGQIYGVRLVKH
jgi:hypothetical protein